MTKEQVETLNNIREELKVKKSNWNKHGKFYYRSCEDILEAAKPIVAKHGCVLLFSEELTEMAGTPIIEATAKLILGSTVLATSNGYAGVQLVKKGMDLAQSFGSSSSYARKYALNALFLIDDTKDSDTEKPSQEKPKPTIELKASEAEKAAAYLAEHGHLEGWHEVRIITEDQIKKLKDLAKKYKK